jgi:alkanesulfonate monooxygenase SsuD/methylene tetrahydromethanopterin reductase-like flavin-dependent oxidoreductase (luciferase family)
MKFGIFYEHQLPRPWDEGAELRLYHDALDQVALADRLGIDYAWEVEHHFLEEYSHSPAPEVFLAACSQRTTRIRLGHGIVLMPPPYNHPAKVAARIAALDLVSNGRVEFGTGESASRLELEGIGNEPAEKRAMWLEATEQTANLLAMDPYPGFSGTYFSMPCRNLVPKPVQKPHPPMWLACSNRDAIRLAARLGLGALTFAFVDADDARHWVNDYYDTLARECVPIGWSVNPNIAMVTGFSCHENREEARRRGLDGLRFFAFALAYYYVFGSHQPGHSDVWRNFEAMRDAMPDISAVTGGIGTPEDLRTELRQFEEVGVDQVIFLQQGGRNRHEDICASLELFATRVLSEFKARDAERERAKRERLAPAIDAALRRKRHLPALAPEAVPNVQAYGRPLATIEAQKEDSPH